MQPSAGQSPCSTCGCRTMGGLEPAPGGLVAKTNQDRGLAIYPWDKDLTAGLFGVYDGHGRIGQEVSEFVIQNLPAALREQLSAASLGAKDAGDALRKAYIRVDADLAENVDASVSGTTAVTCIIKEQRMWIANSGDSRAIVARKILDNPGALEAIDLTIDHKPDSPDEMRRILQMGGRVTPARANGSPSRVWHNQRGLAMSRSIGDHAAATVGVIAEPEIAECVATPPRAARRRHAATPRCACARRGAARARQGSGRPCGMRELYRLTPRPTRVQVRTERGRFRHCHRVRWCVGDAVEPNGRRHHRGGQAEQRARAGHGQPNCGPVVVHVDGGTGRLPRRHHRDCDASAVATRGDVA